MSIPAFSNIIKSRVGEHRKTLLFIALLAAVAMASFYIGYAARAEGHTESQVSIICPVEAYMDANKLAEVPASASSTKISKVTPTGVTSGAYVASKNGKKYYALSCSGAKRIKDENKVFFATSAAALAAGYELASGCAN